MKAFTALLALTITLAASADGAVNQVCRGTDSVTGKPAVFSYLQADWARGAGYTTREVTVVSIGNEEINNDFDLTRPGFSTCRRKAKKSLKFLNDGQMRFTASCGGVALYSITGNCEIEAF